MKIALVQMLATSDLQHNLDKMRGFLETAVKGGAALVVFPEMAYFSGSKEEVSSVIARYPELLNTFCEWAKEFKTILLPGSLREPSGHVVKKPFNSLPIIDAAGKVLAVYRKIFLFKAALSDRSYDETKDYSAGNSVVTFSVAGTTIGCTICYDLRFPELFRALRKRGAQIVLVPAAFTVPTGKAHWQTLLKSRAIENQVFILAPGQVGKSGEGAEKYGHTTAVSPWGEVMLDMEDREGVGMVEVSLEEIGLSAQRVDPWSSRREDLFPIG